MTSNYVNLLSIICTCESCSIEWTIFPASGLVIVDSAFDLVSLLFITLARYIKSVGILLTHNKNLKLVHYWSLFLVHKNLIGYLSLWLSNSLYNIYHPYIYHNHNQARAGRIFGLLSYHIILASYYHHINNVNDKSDRNHVLTIIIRKTRLKNVVRKRIHLLHCDRFWAYIIQLF